MTEASKITVVIVDPDGTITTHAVKPELSTLQGLVDGPIENVSPTTPEHGPWHAYCNEEGKLQRLPVNRVATDIAHRLGWPMGDVLVGTVVFLGETEDGEEAAFPEATMSAIRTMGWSV